MKKFILIFLSLFFIIACNSPERKAAREIRHHNQIKLKIKEAYVVDTIFKSYVDSIIKFTEMYNDTLQEKIEIVQFKVKQLLENKDSYSKQEYDSLKIFLNDLENGYIKQLNHNDLKNFYYLQLQYYCNKKICGYNVNLITKERDTLTYTITQKYDIVCPTIMLN